MKERKEDVIYKKLLYSSKYNLQGKPDYIYVNKKDKMLLPIELKSSIIGDSDSPYEKDLMQLAIYFLIVEDVFKVKPKEGRVIYKDFMFIVKNTKKLRRKIKNVIKDMRDMLTTGEAEAKSSYVKCKSCICKYTVCEYCD